MEEEEVVEEEVDKAGGHEMDKREGEEEYF